ncbi:hypothetical protein DM50_4086 [Burkholderia mallei]|nr:hypothetical protein DM50_4086 [Burkholderia mallei]
MAAVARRAALPLSGREEARCGGGLGERGAQRSRERRMPRRRGLVAERIECGVEPCAKTRDRRRRRRGAVATRRRRRALARLRVRIRRVREGGGGVVHR